MLETEVSCKPIGNVSPFQLLCEGIHTWGPGPVIPPPKILKCHDFNKVHHFFKAQPFSFFIDTVDDKQTHFSNKQKHLRWHY